MSFVKMPVAENIEEKIMQCTLYSKESYKFVRKYIIQFIALEFLSSKRALVPFMPCSPSS